MLEQGTIVATGRIGYPAEYEATAPEALRALGIGKIMTITSTYDHRVIQGQSLVLTSSTSHELLNDHGFYEEVFAALKNSPLSLPSGEGHSVAFAQGGALTETERAMRVSQLIHAFRVRGYLLANTDPLDLQPREHPELNLDAYGLTLWDLDREFLTLGVLPERTAPFRHILGRLRDTYCRRMGVEYMHIHEPAERRWWQKNLERAANLLPRRKKTHSFKGHRSRNLRAIPSQALYGAQTIQHRGRGVFDRDFIRLLDGGRQPWRDRHPPWDGASRATQRVGQCGGQARRSNFCRV